MVRDLILRLCTHEVTNMQGENRSVHVMHGLGNTTTRSSNKTDAAYDMATITKKVRGLLLVMKSLVGGCREASAPSAVPDIADAHERIIYRSEVYLRDEIRGSLQMPNTSTIQKESCKTSNSGPMVRQDP